MPYYSKNTTRMDLHIEEGRNTILIRQKWRYIWSNASGVKNWTGSEKSSFHSKIDSLVWNIWGNEYFLKSKGNSDFAKRNNKKKWDVNFDIEWVNSGEHWQVHAKKVKSFHRSYVNWTNREIHLDSLDNTARKIPRGGNDYFQTPTAHEFGHAIGYLHDEYQKNSPYHSDSASLMNIGSELRDRHVDYILKLLNTMIPDTKFSMY